MCKNEIRPREVVVQAHTCLLVKITLHLGDFVLLVQLGINWVFQILNVNVMFFCFQFFSKLQNCSYNLEYNLKFQSLCDVIYPWS